MTLLCPAPHTQLCSAELDHCWDAPCPPRSGWGSLPHHTRTPAEVFSWRQLPFTFLTSLQDKQLPAPPGRLLFKARRFGRALAGEQLRRRRHQTYRPASKRIPQKLRPAERQETGKQTAAMSPTGWGCSSVRSCTGEPSGSEPLRAAQKRNPNAL